MSLSFASWKWLKFSLIAVDIMTILLLNMFCYFAVFNLYNREIGKQTETEDEVKHLVLSLKRNY